MFHFSSFSIIKYFILIITSVMNNLDEQVVLHNKDAFIYAQNGALPLKY